jgi:hypothetical protein
MLSFIIVKPVFFNFILINQDLNALKMGLEIKILFNYDLYLENLKIKYWAERLYKVVMYSLMD